MRSSPRTGAALMAESVRSPFDYREPPTLDSDGEGSKPPPPRGSVPPARACRTLAVWISRVVVDGTMPLALVLTVSGSGSVVSSRKGYDEAVRRRFSRASSSCVVCQSLFFLSFDGTCECTCERQRLARLAKHSASARLARVHGQCCCARASQ